VCIKARDRSDYRARDRRRRFVELLRAFGKGLVARTASAKSIFCRRHGAAVCRGADASSCAPRANRTDVGERNVRFWKYGAGDPT